MHISRYRRHKVAAFAAGALLASVFWYFKGDCVYRLLPVRQTYLLSGQRYPTVSQPKLSSGQIQKVGAVVTMLKELANDSLRTADRDLPTQLKFSGFSPLEVLTVCAQAEAELPQVNFYIKPAELFADEQARRRVQTRDDYDSSQILEIICQPSPRAGEFMLEAKLHLIDFNYLYTLRQSNPSTVITCTPNRICILDH